MDSDLPIAWQQRPVQLEHCHLILCHRGSQSRRLRWTLKSAKPADVAAQEPVKFDFIVNLKTAKTRDDDASIPTCACRRDDRL